jgi:hypothetical protein
MDKGSYQYREAETVVKRLKKADLVGYIAERGEQHRKDIHTLNVELQRLREENKTRSHETARNKDEIDNLQLIRDAVQQVVNSRTSPIDAKQLALLLRGCAPGLTERGKEKRVREFDDELREAAKVILDILDGCEDVIETVGGGRGAPSYDDLQSALDVAREERDALLEKLGMTDREWSSRGGASYADMEP